MNRNSKMAGRNAGKRWLSAAALALAGTPAAAGTLALKVALPQVDSATYYHPYLAAWIERADNRQQVGTLAVWYDTRLRDGLGKGWLRELRTWWRTAGKNTELPADGISGATRGPGLHTLNFGADHPALSGLAPGEYNVVVEVAREQGGRELLRAPFVWGGAAITATSAGRTELTSIAVTPGN